MPISLKIYESNGGEKLFLASFLRFPNIWVSTVMANASKPWFYTNFMIFSVNYAFFKKYNCIILKPSGLYYGFEIYEILVDDIILSPYAVFLYLATFDDISYP